MKGMNMPCAINSNNGRPVSVLENSIDIEAIEGRVEVLENTPDVLTTLDLTANTLTYTDEVGADTVIDLSPYLDDTNLAYIVSGTVDDTGLATFTRDDATTFTIDFSGLFDTSADLNNKDFTATDGQTAFVVVGEVFTQARVYEGGVRVKDVEFSIANDGTDTTVTFVNPVSLNTWVLVDITK